MPSIPAIDLLAPLGWSHRFDELQMIGAGAMGQVWQAREVATGRSVALKLLDPAHAGDEQTLARLEIEGETLTKLRDAGAHEHVVPILDFKITDEQACLVMEFIPGLNLKKWCETHRLPLQERVKLIAQVAHAAGWFHGLGVVHRDLKPANILVSAVTHQPVIVDFSIAKQDAGLALTLTNEALGTAPYMAPEQIDRSRGNISPATDVYALGATLYEMLTQVHPHPGDLTQVVRRHAEEIRPAPPSALNPDIPRDLECIILKALSHRPADRYADGNALADDLDRFLTGEPVQARPLPLATRLVRRARKKPALTAALAACLVLGAFAVWNWRREAAQREQFILESQLTSAMQQITWDSGTLEQAEATLLTLGQHDAALAIQLRQRFHDDVVHDMEARLQLNHLRDEDYAWLRKLNIWLETRIPDEAGRLQTLIAERAGRWETLANLRAPFTNLHGLFAKGNVRVAGDLLYPVHEGLPDAAVPFTVTNAVTVPMEMACTFQAEAGSYPPVTLVFCNQGARVSAGVYRIRDLSETVRRLIKVPDLDPDSYALTLKLNHDPNRIIHIPDVHLLDQPFRLSLRIERDWAEADINGRYPQRADFTFSLSNGQLSNYWRIAWPGKLGLKELILRSRRADAVSPLEEADLAAMQGRYGEAIHLYERVRGDPQLAAEAGFKTGKCLFLQGHSAEALSVWEALLAGPPSLWRDRSLIRLWTHGVKAGAGDPSRYLSLLPDPLPEKLFGQISQGEINKLEAAYAPVGMSIALPRVDPAKIADAAKAYRLLQLSTVRAASRFALALHSARLELQSRDLYFRGLTDALVTAPDATDLLAVTNCLDQWCRIQPSEKEFRLATNLKKWLIKRPADPTIQAIWFMEQARLAARGSNLHAAVDHIQQAKQIDPKGMDSRVHTSLWMLAGMLYRLQNAEDRAQSAWQKARSVAATVTLQSPLHLMDRVVLHSLNAGWTADSLGEVLPALLAKHLTGNKRTAAQTEILKVFLADPAWLKTFNSVLQSAEGRQFAEDYVLCRQPPRDLIPSFYRLLFEHYFLTTAFPHTTPEQTARVHRIVDILVTEMAMNSRLDASSLLSYLRAWADPALVPELLNADYPAMPLLATEMTWLLRQRHHMD